MRNGTPSGEVRLTSSVEERSKRKEVRQHKKKEHDEGGGVSRVIFCPLFCRPSTNHRIFRHIRQGPEKK